MSVCLKRLIMRSVIYAILDWVHLAPVSSEQGKSLEQDSKLF